MGMREEELRRSLEEQSLGNAPSRGEWFMQTDHFTDSLLEQQKNF